MLHAWLTEPCAGAQQQLHVPHRAGCGQKCDHGRSHTRRAGRRRGPHNQVRYGYRLFAANTSRAYKVLGLLPVQHCMPPGTHSQGSTIRQMPFEHLCQLQHHTQLAKVLMSQNCSWPEDC